MTNNGKNALLKLGITAGAAVIGGIFGGPAGAVGAASVVAAGMLPAKNKEQVQARKDLFDAGVNAMKNGNNDD